MNTFPTPGLVPARKSLPVLKLMMLKKNIMQHVEKRNQEDLALQCLNKLLPNSNVPRAMEGLRGVILGNRLFMTGTYSVDKIVV